VTLIKFLIIAWLPGAAIYRMPFGARDTRAALDVEERIFWAVIVSVAISLGIVLGLAAVQRYTFQRLLAADLAIAAAAVLISRGRLRLGAAAKGPRLATLLPILLIAIGVWRFFPPSEYIVGGKDPGIYLNAGVQIAQRGTIVYRDPDVTSVPPGSRDLFFPSHERHDYYGLRFMGFRIMNPDTGAVVAQFPHLFPASVAIGYGLDGLTGARRTVGLWAILGVLALYFLGVRLVGHTAAFAAAALLSLHVVQVWFARYPNAEVVMQALLLAAMLAHARAHVDANRFFAPIAGTLLGLLLFLRFDSVLGIAAVLTALGLIVLSSGTRPSLGLFAPLAVCAGLAVPYLLGPMRAYAEYPIIFFNSLLWWQHLLLAAGACMGLVALAIGMRLPALGRWIRAWLPSILAAALVAAAIYALYFRAPNITGLASHDAYALRTFTNLYLTVPALFAALIGYVLISKRAFWKAPELFVTFAVFSLFTFYKTRIVPEHFWMTRRFLPVILPGILLFAAAAALSGVRGGWAPTRLLRGSIGVLFIALLAAHYARAARPILPHVEYAGVIPRLEELAGRIGDRDLLVVESREASDTHVLGLPIAYIYARHVLMLNSRVPDKAAFAGFLEWARQRYGRVFFLGGGGTDLLSPAWSAHAVAGARFQIPEYEATMDAYPRVARQKEFDYSLYELTPPDPEAAQAPFDLDVGVHDDLYLVRWHAKETADGQSFRWTRDRSLVSLANLRPDARTLVLWMNDGGRPAAAPAADVTVTLAGVALGTVRVDTGFKPYTFAIPEAVAQRLAGSGGALEMTIATATWRPSAVLGTADDRELGVMVDRVAVK
jgi:hypothetical protein